MSVERDDHVSEVWNQLARVTDPELDQAVTEMGFIDGLEVGEQGDVYVRFRLPTYWCAANFAFMMGHDMREAVGELAWVREPHVELRDHFYAEAINRGLAAGASFEQTCGGEAAGSLDLLRATFRRKAFYARQERLIEHLRLAIGYTKATLVAMSVADLAAIDMAGDDEGEHLRARYLEMRREGPPEASAENGYRGDGDETAFVSASGEAVTAAELPAHLRHLRSVRANSEFNANMCRSVLAARKREHSGADDADLGPIRRVGAN